MVAFVVVSFNLFASSEHDFVGNLVLSSLLYKILLVLFKIVLSRGKMLVEILSVEQKVSHLLLLILKVPCLLSKLCYDFNINV